MKYCKRLICLKWKSRQAPMHFLNLSYFSFLPDVPILSDALKIDISVVMKTYLLVWPCEWRHAGEVCRLSCLCRCPRCPSTSDGRQPLADLQTQSYLPFQVSRCEIHLVFAYDKVSPGDRTPLDLQTQSYQRPNKLNWICILFICRHALQPIRCCRKSLVSKIWH